MGLQSIAAGLHGEALGGSRSRVARPQDKPQLYENRWEYQNRWMTGEKGTKSSGGNYGWDLVGMRAFVAGGIHGSDDVIVGGSVGDRVVRIGKDICRGGKGGITGSGNRAAVDAIANDIGGAAGLPRQVHGVLGWSRRGWWRIRGQAISGHWNFLR